MVNTKPEKLSEKRLLGLLALREEKKNGKKVLA